MATGITEKVFKNVDDTVAHIIALINKYANDPVLDFLRNKDLSDIFDYIAKEIRYVADPMKVKHLNNGSIELLRSPHQTLVAMAGDCDDKTILFASILKAAGIPFRIAVSSQRKDKLLHHVYPEFMYNEKWITIDATYPQNKFGVEKDFTRKIIYYDTPDGLRKDENGESKIIDSVLLGGGCGCGCGKSKNLNGDASLLGGGASMLGENMLVLLEGEDSELNLCGIGMFPNLMLGATERGEIQNPPGLIWNPEIYPSMNAADMKKEESGNFVDDYAVKNFPNIYAQKNLNSAQTALFIYPSMSAADAKKEESGIFVDNYAAKNFPNIYAQKNLNSAQTAPFIYPAILPSPVTDPAQGKYFVDEKGQLIYNRYYADPYAVRRPALGTARKNLNYNPVFIKGARENTAFRSYLRSQVVDAGLLGDFQFDVLQDAQAAQLYQTFKKLTQKLLQLAKRNPLLAKKLIADYNSLNSAIMIDAMNYGVSDDAKSVGVVNIKVAPGQTDPIMLDPNLVRAQLSGFFVDQYGVLYGSDIDTLDDAVLLGIFDAIGSFFGSVAKGIGSAAKWIGGAVGTVASAVGGAVWDGVKWVGNAAWQGVKAVGSGIFNVGKWAFQNFGPLIGAALAIIPGGQPIAGLIAALEAIMAVVSGPEQPQLVQDPATGLLVDPKTGTYYDPATGQPVDPRMINTQAPVMSNPYLPGTIPGTVSNVPIDYYSQMQVPDMSAYYMQQQQQYPPLPQGYQYIQDYDGSVYIQDINGVIYGMDGTMLYDPSQYQQQVYTDPYYNSGGMPYAPTPEYQYIQDDYGNTYIADAYGNIYDMSGALIYSQQQQSQGTQLRGELLGSFWDDIKKFGEKAFGFAKDFVVQNPQVVFNDPKTLMEIYLRSQKGAQDIIAKQQFEKNLPTLIKLNEDFERAKYNIESTQENVFVKYLPYIGVGLLGLMLIMKK